MSKVWNKRDPETPADAMYVGRPTLWGNPFTHLTSNLATRVESRKEAVSLYKDWIYKPQQDWIRQAAKKELKGKDLVCWCAPAECHAEILMEIANE